MEQEERKAAHHELMGGKLHVYKRVNSRYWQCSTYLNGRNRRVSTGEESLEHAKDFAEDWYLELRGKQRAGLLKTGKTFREVAAQFELEYEVITQGERSASYVQGHKDRLRVHLLPFFGDMVVTEITAGTVQQYRVHRHQNPRLKPGQESEKAKPPARSTIHQEIVALRHVLKTAERHKWLQAVPNLSPPYKTSGKITHRAWFSPQSTKRCTRRRAPAPRSLSRSVGAGSPSRCTTTSCSWPIQGFVLMRRRRLEYRDVSIIDDAATGETILEIESGESAVWATARAPREPCARSNGLSSATNPPRRIVSFREASGNFSIQSWRSKD